MEACWSLVINFVAKKLLTKQFARNLLSRKHSGFSIDNSVRIYDERSGEVLTQHIPPKGVQLIWCYGSYSSRTKGAGKSIPHVAERAPTDWEIQHESETGISKLLRIHTFQITLCKRQL